MTFQVATSLFVLFIVVVVVVVVVVPFCSYFLFFCLTTAYCYLVLRNHNVGW